MQKFLKYNKKDMEQVKENILERVNDNPEGALQELKALQATVYTMCGGGFIGDSAKNAPRSFYIDDRCSGFPYPKRAILQAVQVLAFYAEGLGLEDWKLPSVAHFHNCGVF
jgi:hypothetical protein